MSEEPEIVETDAIDALGEGPEAPKRDLSKTPDPVTVTLLKPIRNKGVELDTLTFSEPNLDTIAAAEDCAGGIHAKMRVMLAGMCGVHPAAFGKMTATDFHRCNEACGELSGNIF